MLALALVLVTTVVLFAAFCNATSGTKKKRKESK